MDWRDLGSNERGQSKRWLILVILFVMALPMIANIVRGDGSIEMRIPLDGMGTPKMPDCRDAGVEECKWEAFLVEDKNVRKVETIARDQNDEIITSGQYIEVETAEFEQLKVLDQAGYKKVWIGHVEVREGLWGRGIGKGVWQLGNKVLLEVAGPGAVRVLYDMAGWVPALIDDIEQFVVEQPPMWAYYLKDVIR